MPLCFLQIGSWIQRLDWSWVQTFSLGSQSSRETLDTDERELSTSTHKNRDESHQCKVEQKKPDNEQYTLYDFKHIEIKNTHTQYECMLLEVRIAVNLGRSQL